MGELPGGPAIGRVKDTGPQRRRVVRIEGQARQPEFHYRASPRESRVGGSEQARLVVGRVVVGIGGAWAMDIDGGAIRCNSNGFAIGIRWPLRFKTLPGIAAVGGFPDRAAERCIEVSHAAG